MKNFIQKFRQSSIVFKKSGFLPEKNEDFDEPQSPQSSIFSAETSHTLPTYKCLQKGTQNIFYFM